MTDAQGGEDTTTASVTVNKIPVVVTLSNLNQTYDGAPKPVTVTTEPTGMAVTVTYDGSTDVPTGAGNYAVVATVTDPNHAGSAAGTLVIGKAASTTTVIVERDPLFTTALLQTPCTATVTGAGGLNETLTVSYSNNVSAGTATASASYAGDANHEVSSDTETFVIGKAASTTTVTCEAGPFVYTGLEQTPCTASVTGAGGLSETLTVSYSNNVSAGTATASASYAGDANHEVSSDSKTFVIGKAASTTTVTCGAGPFVYTGLEQTPCTASVTGAGGLSETLTVSYSNNVSAGTATASASYAGDDNHEVSSDTETFIIGKAASTTTVTCEAGPFVYTGSGTDTLYRERDRSGRTERNLDRQLQQQCQRRNGDCQCQLCGRWQPRSQQ